MCQDASAHVSIRRAMTSPSTAQQSRDGAVPGLLCMPQRPSAVVAHKRLVRARLEQQLDGAREVSGDRAAVIVG